MPGGSRNESRSAMAAVRMLRVLVLVIALHNARASDAVPCNGTGAPCVIQIGGLFNKGCGDTAYIASSTAMVRIINTLNNGKGFGVFAGNSELMHYFKLNFTHATYEKGEFDSDGAAVAANLFPRLDFIVGQGAACGAEDQNSLKMGKIAIDRGKIFITQRGPSGFMKTQPGMFSTHLNSDFYPVPAIRRYSLNGVTKAVLLGRKTENFFYRGVQESIRENLKTSDIQLLLDIELDDGNDASWQEKLNATMRSAVDQGTEVLFLTCESAPMDAVTALVRHYQYEHSFKSIWMIGGKCNLDPQTDCGHVLGGTQISPVEVASFRDTLTGMTAQQVVDSPHWPVEILPRESPGITKNADIFTVVSAIAQIIQTYYLFRPFVNSEFMSDPGVYEALRKSMASGKTLGYSFRGPLTWSSTGALNGRLPSAMQNDLAGNYRLIFSDIEEQSFVFPAPSSVPCPWLFFRNYSQDACPLCAHACQKCQTLTSWVEDEVCGCVEGAFSRQQKTGEACEPCPEPGGKCAGNTDLPYPEVEFWGNSSNPVKFYECATSKCIGGPNFTCAEGFCCNMCEGTTLGYSSFGSGLRFKCPATEAGRWALSMCIIVLVLGAFVVINNYLAANFDSMDIFLDAIQRLAITSQFRLRWHRGFTEASIFTIFEIVLLDADIGKPECLLPGGWNFKDSYWLQFAVLFLFLAQIWLPCLFKCVRERSKGAHSWAYIFWDESSVCTPKVHSSIRHSVDILGMMYAGITKLSFDSFTCRDISGSSYLVDDPNFPCNTAEHLSTQVFSVFIIVFYVIGYPAVMGYLLYSKQQKCEIHTKKMLATLGTLYDRYEPPFMWWECWRTVQMSILVFIQVVWWEDPRMQGNLALILFFCSFISHVVTKPYASDTLDLLDTISLAFNCMWVLLGINFYMPSGSGGFYVGDEDTEAIEPFKDGLFVFSCCCLALYFMASVVITILDVQEKVNSERATGKLASLAQKRGFRAKGVDREGDQKGTGDLDQLMEDLDVANTNISSDQLAPDPNFGRDVPGPSSSSKSGRAESGQENKRGSDGEELLQEIQQTLDGTLMLRWVDSADGQLAEEYEALLQIDKWLVDVVSDESKTSHFSLLPEAKFYRDLDKSFPQMLQWIAKHGDQVAGLATSLHSLMEEGQDRQEAYNELVLVRDRSSVIYWLLQEADDRQREKFFAVVDSILKANPDAGESAFERAALSLKRSMSNEKRVSKVRPFEEGN